MFLEFTDYSGVKHHIQVRHIMAVWASDEQKKMKPPQVNFMMQCGSSSEEWLMRGEFNDILDALHACDNWR